MPGNFSLCHGVGKAREENLLNNAVDAKNKALEEGKASTEPASRSARPAPWAPSVKLVAVPRKRQQQLCRPCSGERSASA